MDKKQILTGVVAVVVLVLVLFVGSLFLRSGGTSPSGEPTQQGFMAGTQTGTPTGGQPSVFSTPTQRVVFSGTPQSTVDYIRWSFAVITSQEDSNTAQEAVLKEVRYGTGDTPYWYVHVKKGEPTTARVPTTELSDLVHPGDVIYFADYYAVR